MKRKALAVDESTGIKAGRFVSNLETTPIVPVDEKSVSECFNCVICLAVMVQPVEIQVTDCHHLYCRSCLAGTRDNKCPACTRTFQSNQVVSLQECNTSMFRLYAATRVYCPNSGTGCKWSGSIGDLANHIDRFCEFATGKCLFCSGKKK